jgi:hypothetical protein
MPTNGRCSSKWTSHYFPLNIFCTHFYLYKKCRNLGVSRRFNKLLVIFLVLPLPKFFPVSPTLTMPFVSLPVLESFRYLLLLYYHLCLHYHFRFCPWTSTMSKLLNRWLNEGKMNFDHNHLNESVWIYIYMCVCVKMRFLLN